jgi:hypothetical protein
MFNSQDIITAEVESVDSNGIVRIYKKLGPKRVSGLLEARATSFSPPDPNSKGGGVSVSPEKGSKCLCIKGEDDRWYIISYILPTHIDSAPHKANAPDVTGDTNPGTIKFSTKAGNFIEVALDGMLTFFSMPFAQLILNKKSQSLVAKLKRLHIFNWGGQIDWQDSTEDLHTEFKAVLTDIHEKDTKNSDVRLTFDQSRAGGITRPENDSTYPNKLMMQVGNIPDGHVMELEIRQSSTGGSMPDTMINEKIGLSSDGTHTNKTIITADNRKATLHELGNGILKYDRYESTNGFVEETFNNDGSIILNSNNKAKIEISSAGEIKITTNEPENIIIGGDAVGQSFATKQFVLDYALFHVHMGNIGVPTSPPFYPIMGTPVNIAPGYTAEETAENEKIVAPTSAWWTGKTKGN